MKIRELYGNDSLMTKGVNHTSVSKEIETKEVNTVSIGSAYPINDPSLPTYKELSNKSEKMNAVEEKDITDTVSKISEEDLALLSKDNIDVETLSKDDLESNLQRIKEERDKREVAVEKQAENLDEKEESIEKMKQGETSKQVARMLEQYNLPITEENIAKLEAALQLSLSVTTLSDSSIQYLIKNSDSITPDNIYKAAHSGQYSKEIKTSNETYAAIKTSIEQVVEKTIGMDKEEGNIIGKWLFEHQLPVTEDSLWMYKDITSLKDNYDSEDILDKLASGYATGISSMDTYIGNMNLERVQSVQLAIDNINMDGIKYTLQNNHSNHISISDLYNGQMIVEKEKGLDSIEPEDTIDIESVKVLRQLEELRLKMTIEAGNSLLKKGISIDTESLSKVVDELKEIEDAYYTNLLNQGNVEINDTTIDLLKNSLTTIDSMKEVPSYVLGTIVKNQLPQTIDTIYSEGSKLEKSLTDASKSYETLMTTPSKEYGDSIKKAFQNVDTILEDLGLDTTKENQKAVRILGYSAMDITTESIETMKSFDMQVNYMMDELHPNTVVELIRRGENPIDIPLDTLNQFIDEINEEIGIPSEEKYSKFLWKLEKNNEISKEEKESYIGIYRLLHNVDKTDGAAIGYVVKAKKELTLNNLLEAVRTNKLGSLEANIDDTYGLSESVSSNIKSISSQIEEGFSKDQKATVEYNSILVKESKELFEQKSFGSLDKNEDRNGLTIEELHDELNQLEDDTSLDKDYYSSKRMEYNDVLKNSKQSSFLLKELGIVENIQTIRCATEYLSKDNTVYHQYKKLETKQQEQSEISDISNRLIDSFTDKDSIVEKVNELKEEFDTNMEDRISNELLSFDTISQMRSISSGFEFISNLSLKEKYQIPIQVGEDITNVNVTLIRNTEENGKVDMTVQSEILGQLAYHITVRDNKINGVIQVDSKKAEEVISSDLDNIKEGMKEQGLEVSSLSVVLDTKAIKGTVPLKTGTPNKAGTPMKIGSSIKSVDNSKEESFTLTNTLYLVAKGLLQGIKTLETNTTL